MAFNFGVKHSGSSSALLSLTKTHDSFTVRKHKIVVITKNGKIAKYSGDFVRGPRVVEGATSLASRPWNDSNSGRACNDGTYSSLLLIL